ncbi:peptide ABC transporter substrate-binding protein [Patescibacteria group bacterium]|nr:MAG: peptide ABC transporter substrate-binding protein [Patescibacteria group bacterium]
MQSIRAFVRALLKRRVNPIIQALEKRVRILTPSDRLIAGVLAIMMVFSVGALLASISLALTEEVPAYGGSYTEGLIGSPRFINPVLAISDTDRDLTTLVYSGLMRSNPDGSLTPDLAESYSISNDKRTYTFVIKSSARFHDNKPVTADDVVYTIRSTENPNIKSPRRADWEGVSVSALDERTVSFTLKSPYAPFLENMTLGILPKHVWQEVSPEEFPFSTRNTDPIGSGPYRVANVKRNSSGIPIEYTLTAVTSGTRIPYIKNFIFKIYTNAETLKDALSQNKVQGAHSIDTTGSLSSFALHEAVFGRIFGVFFNQSQNKIFADASVRRALDRAVDKESIISRVLRGHGAVIDGPVPPRTAGTEIATTTSEVAIEAARQILTDGGWKPGDDGVLVKTITVGKKKESVRLAFSLSTSNVTELKQAAEMVADDWRRLGAEVDLKFFDQNDLNLSVIRPRTYDALLFGLVIGRDLDLFAFWHSSQRNDPGLNIALYANSATDKKLETLRTTDDFLSRIDKAQEIATDIRNETAAIFLYTPYFVYRTPADLSGIHLGTISTPSDRFLSADRWYLKTERVWPIFNTKKVEEYTK